MQLSADMLSGMTDIVLSETDDQFVAWSTSLALLLILRNVKNCSSIISFALSKLIRIGQTRFSVPVSTHCIANDFIFNDTKSNRQLISQIKI